MKGNVIVGQSGGPTAAINSSLAGVYRTARDRGAGKVYGMLHGIQGLLQERYIDLSEYITSDLDTELLKRTPAAFLGSCRYKLPEIHEDRAVYDKIFEILEKLNIEAFIYIGGNDSMDTIKKLSDYAIVTGFPTRFVGCPKTIDNDLIMTDHTPGFGSAAKYAASMVREIALDASVYQQKSVTIIELMGRHAGWLTAASSLSRVNGNRGPDFIYLCEVPFSISRFLDDIRSRQSENRNLLIAVSEGIRDENGTYLSEQTPGNRPDRFGHRDIAGTGGVLAQIVRNELGCKTRSLELNLMQRCAAHLASRTDLNESRLLGAKAVQCAVQGQTGKMATLLRLPSKDRYRIQFASADVSLVANREKTVPRQWINREGNGITREMTDYLTPLMEGEVPVLYRNRFPEYFTISLE